MSVMEQRFHAVMECLGGTPKAASAEVVYGRPDRRRVV